MNRYKLGMVLVFIISIYAFSQVPKTEFSIKYISSENIYIDSGALDGLAVGDTLNVIRANNSIATLIVKYTADHSAACTILQQQVKVQPGDVIRAITIHAPQKSEQEEKPTTRVRESKTQIKTPINKTKTRVSGNASLQWYHIKDLSAGNYQFDQPGMRFNIKIKNLFAQNLNFQLKTRSRYNMRQKSFSSTIPKSEWRNRIYTASLSFDDENATLNFKLGRIISNTFSGIGYIDGLLIQQNVTERIHYGAFAGTQPQWQYSDYQTSIQKYGAFVNYVQGEYGAKRFESTLAAAGEYHGSEVSREFIYFQNSYSSPLVNLFASTELDINRDWRKSRSGENISLTNLYLNMSVNVTRGITTGISLDNRKNYYTYEIRSLAENLFDTAMRYGLRWNVNMRLPGNYRFFANAGLRARETDTENTYSYAAGLTRNNITRQRFYINIYGSGFHNYFTDGMNNSIQFGKNFKAGHDFSISYVNYYYTLNTSGSNRLNSWIRVNSSMQFFNHFYVDENYEYAWGDDSPGHRIYAEIGYRF